MNSILSFLAAAIRLATPIALATLACTISEKAGVINIGIEGIMTGGAFSVTVMYLLKKTGAFRISGISAAGGAAHNIGQLFIAHLTLGELNLVYYMPVLVVFGTLFGSIMGVLSGMVYERIGKGDNNDRFFKREA